jgi:gamma-glutamyl:cysteine ligase YbdK (ATP-grasp superfamily)
MPSDNSLFSRFGVELEYMIVDRDTLDVRPLADRLIHGTEDQRKNEIRRGSIRWSNELVSHVIEIKTDGPVASLQPLSGLFQEGVNDINRQLEPLSARLMPGGMHPWMDPEKETVLWQHGDREIYDTFNRIFDCRGHGWSNLQSTHINLPFANEEEFRRLHSAIRLVLPLVPVLAAASPYYEGRAAPVLDMRLEAYRGNCARIPSITGRLVPERIRSIASYKTDILERIYKDMVVLDPDGVLAEEWVNARGAIARFERGTIEIRVMDNQECPAADLAIVQFIVEILKELVAQKWSSLAEQEELLTADLEQIFLTALLQAEDAPVRLSEYVHAFGANKNSSVTLSHLIWSLFERLDGRNRHWGSVIETILRKGCLARRIRRASGKNPGHEKLLDVYRELADCLANGQMLHAK